MMRHYFRPTDFDEAMDLYRQSEDMWLLLGSDYRADLALTQKQQGELFANPKYNSYDATKALEIFQKTALDVLKMARN